MTLTDYTNANWVWAWVYENQTYEHQRGTMYVLTDPTPEPEQIGNEQNLVLLTMEQWSVVAVMGIRITSHIYLVLHDPPCYCIIHGSAT